MRGQLFILSGPSGVGKGTVLSKAIDIDPTLWVAVSQTTRKPRPGEVPADFNALMSRRKAYQFVNEAEFDAMKSAGGFLECEGETAGKRYGTLRQPIVDRIKLDLSALLEIEVDGAARVRQVLPDDDLPKPVTIFLLPPDWRTLERRLRGRATDTEDQIQARLAKARVEIERASEYDFHIVNGDARDAAKELVSFMRTSTVSATQAP